MNNTSNTSVNFTSFTRSILKHLQEALGENYSVFSHNVKKNNGIELTGVIAKREGCNASPTIYINEFYHEGMTKEEIKKIADLLYESFQEAEFEDNVDLSDFIRFDRAKEKIAFKLIHAERNRELLQMIPNKPFYNLAMVFYYTVCEAPFNGKAAILIYNSHMRQWGTNLEELYQIAAKNTPVLFPGTIDRMEEVMRGILKDGLQEELAFSGKSEEGELFGEGWIQEVVGQMMEDLEEVKMPMYVLTNRQKLYGAACMLYPGVLKEFGRQLGQDFYILPSSVHEVILVPGETGAEHGALQKIVKEINQTQVAEDEVLADSVYYYSRGEDRILWIS